MLSSSFKSAEELKFPENFRLALIEFHRRAASGEIPDHLFDMKIIGEPECGTPGCVLGWVRVIDNEAYNDFYRMITCRNSSLKNPWGKLFHGLAPHRTPTQAAEAVYQYLTTGRHP